MVENDNQLIDRGYIKFVEGVFSIQSDEGLVQKAVAWRKRYNKKHPDKPLPIHTPEQILADDSRTRETRDRLYLVLTKPDLIPLLKSAVDQTMSSLFGYEQRALQVYFGFGQENQGEIIKDTPLPEVGRRIYDDHQVGGERARQIIAKALRKARHHSRSKFLMDVLYDDSSGLESFN